MKKISILVILILSLVAIVQPATAITGGTIDYDLHPNVGIMIAEIDGEPVWRCSGTLIAPTVFLTAGHCAGDGATWARVWFETDMTSNTEYPYGGETSFEGQPVAHPLYSWEGGDYHDVGVVLLTEPVYDIAPALLPEPDLLATLKKARILEGGYEEGVYFTSVGYGGTLASWPPPVLKFDRIRRYSLSEYVALTPNHLHLFQRAVFDEAGSCFGDSGGPLFLNNEGEDIIVAVTSTGDAQCIATGLNYRVDTAAILQWILDQLPEEE